MQKMLHDKIDRQEQEHLAIEEVLTSQLLDFSAEDAELFSEALLSTSCEFSSSSDQAAITTSTTNTATDLPSSLEEDFCMDPATLSSLLDYNPDPDELTAAISYNNNSGINNRSNNYNNDRYAGPTMLANQQGQFQMAGDERSTTYTVGALLAQAYEDCLIPVGTEMGGSISSCTFTDPGIGRPIYSNHQMGVNVGTDGRLGLFSGMTGMGLQEAIDHNGTGGVTMGMHYGMEMLQQHPYASSNSAELQVFGNRQHQQLVRSCSSPTQVKDMSSLDESSFKVGRLSAEERREKIHRYMKKRNERNFTKKIKYACRKTLADSRPRVRGRFAKNDDSGEPIRPSSSNNEYEDDEEVVVKEEDIFDSDILAHLSGVNSFNCNYTLESWI